jgi:hypothetical protein
VYFEQIVYNAAKTMICWMVSASPRKWTVAGQLFICLAAYVSSNSNSPVFQNIQALQHPLQDCLALPAPILDWLSVQTNGNKIW